MKHGMKERDIQNAIVDLLRWRGWMVREISQPRMVSGDLVGVPDVIAWKRGVTLLIECKRPGGKLRASQIVFYEQITPHLANTLVYRLSDDFELFCSWLDQWEK